jgi:Inner membrane protein CreD
MARSELAADDASVKAVVITILTVLMLWPLSRVESLVSERQNLQREAYAVIAAHRKKPPARRRPERPGVDRLRGPVVAPRQPAPVAQ